MKRSADRPKFEYNRSTVDKYESASSFSQDSPDIRTDWMIAIISFPFNSFSLENSYMTHTTRQCTEKHSFNISFFIFFTGKNDETIFLKIR